MLFENRRISDAYSSSTLFPWLPSHPGPWASETFESDHSPPGCSLVSRRCSAPDLEARKLSSLTRSLLWRKWQAFVRNGLRRPRIDRWSCRAHWNAAWMLPRTLKGYLCEFSGCNWTKEWLASKKYCQAWDLNYDLEVSFTADQKRR